MTQHMRPRDAEGIHQTSAILGEQFSGIGHVRLVTTAQTAMIVDHHLIVLGELRHLRYAPRRAADPCAGDEYQRIPLAVNLIVEIDVVDLDLAASDWLQLLHPVLPLSLTRRRDAIESIN